MPAKRSSKTAKTAKTVKKARKPAKPKAAAKTTQRAAVTISVGDEITCSATNRQRRYRPISGPGDAPAREYLSGIVCSIRDIRSGETVKVAAGNMDQYVFEVLDGETFAPSLSSPANSETQAARERVGAQLEKLRQGKQIPNVAVETLLETELAGLDGWRIVKLQSSQVALAGADRPQPKPRKAKRR